MRSAGSQPQRRELATLRRELFSLGVAVEFEVAISIS